MNPDELTALEKKLAVKFKDKDLLHQVFVHRSYLNEHPGFPLEHNERLEFLGDAVLELVVTEALYDKYDQPEGMLTSYRSALVKGEQLAKIASKLKFHDHLLLSRGEQLSGGREKQLLLANVFEAFIGALYLDQDYAAVQAFILKHLWPEIDEIISRGLHRDPKSQFQELAQEKLGITPTYKVVFAEGPDHKKVFTVEAFLDKKPVGKGQGPSKQTAQAAAAEDALRNWKLEVR